MPTHDKAGPADVAMMEGVMHLYHRRLVDSGVTVGLLVARKAKAGGDSSALKLHGYPCAAVARVTKFKERLYGAPDCEITLDAATWEALPDADRAALLDHELTHFEPAYDKDKQLKSDDRGRPVLKLRLHDVQVGWFAEVAARHGKASYEVKQATEVAYKWTQLRMAFEDGLAMADQADAERAFLAGETDALRPEAAVA